MDENSLKYKIDSLLFCKFYQYLANSNATKEALKCTASIVADSIVDAISFITGVLFSDQKTSFSQIRLRLRPNLSSEIWPNLASAEFEKVKFGATLILATYLVKVTEYRIVYCSI